MRVRRDLFCVPLWPYFSVILSGVSTARSAVLTQSKDPITDKSSGGLSGSSLIGPWSIPRQTPSELPTSQLNLPTSDSSIRSEQSSFSSTSLSIASLFRSLDERRRSFRSRPSGCNDIPWRIPRFRRSYAAVHAGRCCWLCRCKACRSHCTWCRRSTRDSSWPSFFPAARGECLVGFIALPASPGSFASLRMTDTGRLLTSSGGFFVLSFPN